MNKIEPGKDIIFEPDLGTPLEVVINTLEGEKNTWSGTREETKYVMGVPLQDLIDELKNNEETNYGKAITKLRNFYPTLNTRYKKYPLSHDWK